MGDNKVVLDKDLIKDTINDNMLLRKPMISIDEQIELLKSKGVKFNIMNEDDAKDYLSNNNNYFKLTSYRKNYKKHPDGAYVGQYINLEFAYLVDLAIIDMRIRYHILHMALDIEHYIRMDLIKKVSEYNEDGYTIISEYCNSLEDNQKSKLKRELERNKENIYCGDLLKAYENNYPIWVFVELITFGSLIYLYKFCAEKFNDKQMKDNFFMFKTCKEIRNAAAHNNCIINDLKTNTLRHKTNTQVVNWLASMDGLNKNFRKNKMTNARLQQIVTLLYVHEKLVTSKGVKTKECDKLRELKQRINREINYYESNEQIRTSFKFLSQVIDIWITRNYNNIT